MHPSPEAERMFKSWMQEHAGIVGKVTRTFAQNPADAKDLKQEVMLQLWMTASKFYGQSKASTWIYKVCLNTALMWRRGKGRRERRMELESDLSDFEAGGDSPAENAAQTEMLTKLYEAIRAMPETDRTLVLMTLDGLSYREIAEVTGLTENHVGVALSRARKHLTELMKGVTHELG